METTCTSQLIIFALNLLFSFLAHYWYYQCSVLNLLFLLSGSFPGFLYGKENIGKAGKYGRKVDCAGSFSNYQRKDFVQKRSVLNIRFWYTYWQIRMYKKLKRKIPFLYRIFSFDCSNLRYNFKNGVPKSICHFI